MLPIKKTFFRSLFSASKLVTVEPYLFLCLFGYAGRSASFRSILADRTCRITLNHPDAVCGHLDSRHPAQQQEEGGNDIYLGVVLSSTLPAVVVALFLGPWSDKYSRKLPLVFAAGGMFLESLAGAVLAAIPGAPPLWFVGAALLSGASGGFVICTSAALSYLSDVTDERGEEAVRKGAMWRHLASPDNVRQSYVMCSRKRPGNIRAQMWMLVWIGCCQRFTDTGTPAAGLPFARKMFGWGASSFARASVAFCSADALVTLLVTPLLSDALRLHEAAIGLVGALSLMAKMVLTSVAYWDYVFYIAWMSGALTNGIGIAVGSRLSKLVQKEELGRAFSLLGACESVALLLGPPTFRQIYNATVRLFPGFAFAAAAVFLLPCALAFAWMQNMPTISLAEYAMQELEQMSRPLEVTAAPPSVNTPPPDTQHVVY